MKTKRVTRGRNSAGRKICRGNVLMVALLVVLVLLSLSLGMILQGRVSPGSEKKVGDSIAHSRVAMSVAGLMIEALTSEDPEIFKIIGLQGAPPPAGGEVVAFSGVIDGVDFWGSFNGGDVPWSTFEPVPADIDLKNFGYSGTGPRVFDDRRHPVPPSHSIIFVNTRSSDGWEKTFFFTFSNNSPLGVTAPLGSIYLRDAKSLINPGLVDREPEDGGLKFFLTAGDRVNVAGEVTSIRRDSLSVLDDRGSILPSGVVKDPAENLRSISGQIRESAVDAGFAPFASAIGTAGKLYLGYEMLDLGGFYFDGKTLIWNSSLVVPRRFSLRIPLDIRITGDLIMAEGALLAVGGNLTLDGHLIIDENCTVLCDGLLQAKSQVQVTCSLDEVMGTGIALMGVQGVVLEKGVRHLKLRPGYGNVDFPFEPVPSPFPLKDKNAPWRDNPAAVAFLARQRELFQPVVKTAPGPARFMAGSVNIPIESLDLDMPGLLIASENGGVEVTDPREDSGMAGLIISRKDIVLDFPAGGSGAYTGIMLSLEGDVRAYNARYRYYPYYSWAKVNQGAGRWSLLGITARPHLISWGEYLK